MIKSVSSSVILEAGQLLREGLLDALSNTFGLHASSALIFAYFRPVIFKLFAPRDGYENTEESNIYTMGTRWFIYAFGLLLLIHHTWFFLIEIFKLNEILLLLRKFR